MCFFSGLNILGLQIPCLNGFCINLLKSLEYHAK